MFKRCMACCLLLCLFPVAVLAADVTSQINELRIMYGGAIPEDALQAARDAYTPVTEAFGEITIDFSEILWDGRWVYSAVEVVPNDPDAVLVMPGSAWADDLVRGGYGENERDDDRTFLQAARQDGKKLLAVYVYPILLDELPEYFLDHFQRSGDVSVLLSGGQVETDANTLETEWSVLTLAYDTATGEPLLETRFETTVPLVIERIGTPAKQTYRAPDADLPFDTLVVTQTSLAVYTAPAWRSDEDYHTYNLQLMETADTPYPEGASAETYTAQMDALPQTLLLQLTNCDSGDQVLVTLTAVEA